LIRTNYLGPAALARAALPLLMEGGGGRITVVSSVLGKYGTVSKASYAASKHALHGFFDSLRYEVEPHGVGVTIACPGVVETEIAKRAIGPDGKPLGEANAYTRPGGMSAARCAHLIARAIETGREEITIGGVEAHAVKLKRHFPRLFSLAHRMYTRRKPKWS
ncbi:MAG: SDR family NAD(P)-dependent oxidoreductase, partial [Gemmatimonadetes bacterium]|nr:SDR family NAD(P)-dependent oxidoreductase [Gemmatimonadota bacterium]